MKPHVLRCVLVDPSLFTAPYDAALTQALVKANVAPVWVTRPARHGDEQEIPAQFVAPIFYKRSDAAHAIPGALRAAWKGLAHLAGLVRLLMLVARTRPDVVHVQWAVLPLFDAAAIWLVRWCCPVVLTVHDPVPFNGQRLSLLQRLGFDLPIRLADRVIVHTRSGRGTLVKRGIDAGRIAVVPHGPLPLRAHAIRSQSRDPRWTFVLFGEIKPYKGLDVLVEALAQLPPDVLHQTRVIVAGRARMDLATIEARIETLGLQSVVELQPRRLTEQEMADLFAQADCFVFPYREIDASGVYFLVKGLGKWLIASRVGIFAEDMVESVSGTLVPSGDVNALTAALQRAILQRPAPASLPTGNTWTEIGGATRLLYELAIRERTARFTLARPGDADA
jgi:glycosyltransferase involved in cell wall biosynthesis